MDKIHQWVHTMAMVSIVVCLLVLVGGNQSAPEASFGAQSHTNSGYVINEDGTDDDSRIEGNNEANLLFVDAGNDRIGVATATPAALVDIFDTATSSLKIDGAATSCLVMRDDGGVLRYFTPSESVIGGMATTTATVCGF